MLFRNSSFSILHVSEIESSRIGYIVLSRGRRLLSRSISLFLSLFLLHIVRCEVVIPESVIVGGEDEDEDED